MHVLKKVSKRGTTDQLFCVNIVLAGRILRYREPFEELLVAAAVRVLRLATNRLQGMI